MARILINGLGIEYELLGREGAPAVALTPGGRFSKDSPGLRELGEALVAGGRRVLLWDRPNCGASDICFQAESESGLHGRTLAKLIQELDLGSVALAGGAAGSRVSLIAAAAAPAQVSHLVLWWLGGGPVGLMELAHKHCCEPATAASLFGMEGVVTLPGWSDQVARNPRARDVLLSQDVDQFIARMQQWALAYRPSDVSPIPGMVPDDFAVLKMPTLIFHNGRSDVMHTRQTSEWVHELMPHSRMADPPWGDGEWNDRVRAVETGAAPGLFVNWPQLAPLILEFTEQQWRAVA
ncbi:alpha/beta fold hydrolase [Rhizorhabdus dicambivorans]|uniref:Alpha/beta hydrolase n=1 Tax=Rhizorhabdus dicambivorans TaxID=1850238 RepID=A0A2A4FQB3_9SPHN|nr:alpha/beta hydrolase [Rhizorhabdus dicambivorans]ATE65433.1 alpha/beta hydrolase [Rhizorhabdus dicambivorans]PCE40603.1 alpha/beta hydrolase [Rhizorhabdus dicambivorans]